MGHRILVICDQLEAGWVKEAQCVEQDVEWFSVVLGFSATRYLRENRALFQPIHHSVLPVEQYGEKAQQNLQEFYPEFVYHFPRHVRLGGRTLLELLRRKNGVNLWWFGETCEKSPLRGSITKQLYILALLQEVLNNESFDSFWIWLGDPDLRTCISKGLSSGNQSVRIFKIHPPRKIRELITKSHGFALIFRLIALRCLVIGRVFFTRFILFIHGIRPLPKSNKRPIVGLFSRYPVLWRNPYTPTHEERYFSYLEPLLRENAHVLYFVLISDAPSKLWRNRDQARKTFLSPQIEPLELYIHVSDLFKHLLDLRQILNFLTYHYWMSPDLQPKFLSWDITNLWDVELRRTLTGAEIQQNLLLMTAVDRLTTQLHINALIHPLEFQPMERAIWKGAHKKTVSIGIQHSSYCRNHFMYFFKEKELKEYCNEMVKDASPLPDYYFVAGTWPFEMMIYNGVPTERLNICGAIRYNNLAVEEFNIEKQKQLRKKLSLPIEKVILLVLTPQSRDESIDMVEVLAQVALELKESFIFLFKCHYHSRIEEHIEQLYSQLSEKIDYRILDVDGPLYDYIRASNMVFVGGTTAAAEALALARLPLVYVNPTLLNLSPLMDFSDISEFISSPDQLTTTLEKLKSGELSTKLFFSKRSKVLEKIFYKLDRQADRRILSFLKGKELL